MSRCKHQIIFGDYLSIFFIFFSEVLVVFLQMVIFLFLRKSIYTTFIEDSTNLLVQLLVYSSQVIANRLRPNEVVPHSLRRPAHRCRQ